MKFTKKQLALIGIAALVIIGGGSLIFFMGGKERLPEVKLVLWGAENLSSYEKLLENYGKLRPNVKIEYAQIPEANYKQRVLNALAAGNGPDLIFINNRDVMSEIDKIVPAPIQSFSITKLRELFPSVVEDDFAVNGQIYALPLYIDTLSLIYNKTLLDNAAITAPPATWTEFLKDVNSLRVLGDGEEIIRAGVALGGSSRSVDYATDILQLLLLQNGVRMYDQNGLVSFADERGTAAFNFYLQFTDTGSPSYSWNDNLQSSLRSFASGKTAMILGYRSSLKEIKSLSPFLRFGVSAIPRTGLPGDVAVSFAKYRGLAVTRQSIQSQWAWDFIISAATNPSISQPYLTTTRELPALRSEISKFIGDPEYDVFARQALTARSWQSPNDAKVREALDTAIKNVLTGQLDSKTALKRAEAEIRNNQ